MTSHEVVFRVLCFVLWPVGTLQEDILGVFLVNVLSETPEVESA
jgi:hypothetical protein